MLPSMHSCLGPSAAPTYCGYIASRMAWRWLTSAIYLSLLSSVHSTLILHPPFTQSAFILSLICMCMCVYAASNQKKKKKTNIHNRHIELKVQTHASEIAWHCTIFSFPIFFKTIFVLPIFVFYVYSWAHERRSNATQMFRLAHTMCFGKTDNTFQNGNSDEIGLWRKLQQQQQQQQQ